MYGVRQADADKLISALIGTYNWLKGYKATSSFEEALQELKVWGIL